MHKSLQGQRGLLSTIVVSSVHAYIASADKAPGGEKKGSWGERSRSPEAVFPKCAHPLQRPLENRLLWLSSGHATNMYSGSEKSPDKEVCSVNILFHPGNPFLSTSLSTSEEYTLANADPDWDLLDIKSNALALCIP